MLPRPPRAVWLDRNVTGWAESMVTVWIGKYMGLSESFKQLTASHIEGGGGGALMVEMQFHTFNSLVCWKKNDC